MMDTRLGAVLFAFLTCSFAAQWASGPANGAHLYACSGNDVTLDWTLNLASGDVVHDTEWNRNSPTQEPVAFMSHATFVALPGYAGRVQHLPEGGAGAAGVRLLNVSPADSGNYSVEVTGMAGHGEFFTVIRSVFVDVRGGLATVDGSLHVTQSAEVSASGGGVSITLMCGHFIFPNQPHFDVLWTTPSGSVVRNSEYRNGTFVLHLPSPVEAGTYTCRVPASDSATCLTTDREASYVVDALAVKLILLEARTLALEMENSKLKLQLVNDTASLDRKMKSLQNAQMAFEQASIEQDAISEAKLNNLTFRVHKLELTTSSLGLELSSLQSNVSHRLDVLDSTTHQLTASFQQLQHQVTTLETHQARDDRALAGLQAEDIVQALQIEALNSTLGRLTGLVSEQVSFQAKQLAHKHLQPDHILVVNAVVSNHGNGYQGSTGVFTAPVSGTYLFLATSGPDDVTIPAGFHLSVMGGGSLADVYAASSGTSSVSTLHAVVSLQAGQQVALKADNSATYLSDSTMFTGVLISPD